MAGLESPCQTADSRCVPTAPAGRREKLKRSGAEPRTSPFTSRGEPMDLNQLNGPQKKVLRRALLDAFGDDSSLNVLLQYELSKPTLNMLVPPKAFEYQV